MKTKVLAIALLTGVLAFPAWAVTAPKIQFDQLVYDFGKTSQVETVTGTFKFKNVGDGVLKIDAPKPSCGCTIATLKSDTLAPGESGELAFTLNLGRSKAQLEKHIAVTSNDPQTPETSLTIKVDYTPLYELNPMVVTPNLAFGANATELFTTLTRTDGKPFQVQRLEPSKPWIKAKVEPADAKADNASARIRVAVQRDGSPRHFNEYVLVYTGEQTNIPVATISVYGEVKGELSLSPDTLYWSVAAAASPSADRPESQAVRRVTIRSANGRPLALKNPKSTLPGISVELVPQESGKYYELVATLTATPSQTVAGNLTFETSVAAQPRMEVPVIVNVFKP